MRNRRIVGREILDLLMQGVKLTHPSFHKRKYIRWEKHSFIRSTAKGEMSSCDYKTIVRFPFYTIFNDTSKE